ncbi:hypothetical protein L873DRAFT_824943 [Choiromyces venosus 120613-1]|uniref:Uncharacterized protein n=1 Tax=Choiromyces venosus 120613-1 TaxID=1336337 RepID=A0A3N4JPT3_9PEZI|nr:hypothetical protein L873DRAFT_824943 [Choiromyces venosus 120613-1]
MIRHDPTSVLETFLFFSAFLVWLLLNPFIKSFSGFWSNGFRFIILFSPWNPASDAKEGASPQGSSRRRHPQRGAACLGVNFIASTSWHQANHQKSTQFLFSLLLIQTSPIPTTYNIITSGELIYF